MVLRMIAGANGQSGCQTTLDEKEKRSEHAHPTVKTLLEELIGCKDLQPVVDGQKETTDQYDRDGHSKIELDESKAAFIAEPRCTQEGDRRRLSGHHTETDAEPSHLIAAFQVLIDRLFPPRSVDPDADYAQQAANELPTNPAPFIAPCTECSSSGRAIFE